MYLITVQSRTYFRIYPFPVMGVSVSRALIGHLESRVCIYAKQINCEAL